MHLKEKIQSVRFAGFLIRIFNLNFGQTINMIYIEEHTYLPNDLLAGKSFGIRVYEREEMRCK